jgi:hypothetical protein
VIPHRLQRFFLLFFACTLFAGSAGVYFYQSLNIVAHRNAIRTGELSEEVITLQLSKSDFKSILWVGETDFIFNGQLYDIESFSVSHGTYILKCEHDECESDMLSSIEKQLNSDHGTKTNKVNKENSFCFECTLFSKTFPLVNSDQPMIYADANALNAAPAHTFTASPPPEA